MPETNPPNLSKRADSSPPFVGAVARLYWMLLGNAALSLIALDLAQRASERTRLTDAAFRTVVASPVLLRYLDLALAVWIAAHALRGGLESPHHARS
jgi:hypothetical protein